MSVGIKAPARFPGSPGCDLWTPAPAAACRLCPSAGQDRKKTPRFNQFTLHFSLLYLLVVHPLPIDSASSGNKGCDLLTRDT